MSIRSEWVTEREAMALFSVLINTFSQARDAEGNEFNKFFVFDEAHKYMGQGKVSAEIVGMIREMRHRHMTVIVASQDADSVEYQVHELSTVTVVHRTRSIDGLKAMRKANAAWNEVTIEQLAALELGEAFITAAKASVKAWSVKAQRAQVRPTCAQPGGTTKTATGREA